MYRLFAIVIALFMGFVPSLSVAEEGAKKPWSVTYSGTYEYDDNVVLLPGQQQLPSDISNQSSSVGKNQLTLDYRTPLSAGEVSGTYSYFRSDYSRGDLDRRFNLQLHTVNLGYKQPAPIGKLGILVNYSRAFLVNNDYLQLFKVLLTDEIKCKYGYSVLSFDYTENMYKEEKGAFFDRDGSKFKFGGAYYHYLFSNKGYLKGGVYGLYEETDGSNYDSQGVDLSLALRAPLPLEINMTIEGGVVLDRYDNNYITSASQILSKRHDDDYYIGVELTRKIGKYFQAAFKYQHKDEKSNISSFEYDKNTYAFTIKAMF